MARKIRPELSKDNPFYISKHRYYELKHFCLQYPEWKEELLKLNYMCRDSSDPTGDIAVRESELLDKIRLVENNINICGGTLSPWLLKGVTQDYAYPYLRTVMGIPCGKDMYYATYRKFFYALSQIKQGV